MKAIRVNEFGGPDVMKLEEIDRPVPKADEILVKMYASSVNPADYIVREGGNESIMAVFTWITYKKLARIRRH